MVIHQPDQEVNQDCGVANTGLVTRVPRSLDPGIWPTTGKFTGA